MGKCEFSLNIKRNTATSWVKYVTPPLTNAGNTILDLQQVIRSLKYKPNFTTCFKKKKSQFLKYQFPLIKSIK